MELANFFARLIITVGHIVYFYKIQITRCIIYFIDVYYNMKIIETPIFTKRLKNIVDDDDEYRQIQNILILNPESGKIIKGSGGLRKIRWSGSGRGKRGGSRIIYYWLKDEEIIFMLLIYLKNESEDLTQAQIKILKSIVESELK